MMNANINSNRKGITIVLTPVILGFLVLAAAMMVDFGSFQAERSSMQNASDAAALAAIMRISGSDSNSSRQEAYEYASAFANYNQRFEGDVVSPNDVEFGSWDSVIGQFVPSDANEITAVRVTVVRGQNQSNFLTVPFLNALGVGNLSASQTSIAHFSSCSSTRAIPLGLREEDFGAVNPELTSSNPWLDGPSAPETGVFAEGDEVIVMMFGHPEVCHLTLNFGANGAGGSPEEVQDILANRVPQIPLKVGDTCYVFSSGKQPDVFANELLERLDLPYTSKDRLVVMPILETMSNSRGSGGNLNGTVRVSDFVPVFLNRVEQRLISDPNQPSQTITVSVIVGTVKTRLVKERWGGSIPSGAGGKTLRTVGLAK